MILVRDIFQLKFGKAKDTLSLWKEGSQIIKKVGLNIDRILVDLTGPYYTLALETKFKSLAEYEKIDSEHVASEDWKQWYQKFVLLVESGRREIFRIVE